MFGTQNIRCVLKRSENIKGGWGGGRNAGLLFSHTLLTYNDLENKAFCKYCGKRRNAGN